VSFEVNVKRLKRGVEHLPKRMLNQLLTRVMMIYAIGWNHLFKHRHFGDGAAERYDYAPRQGERSGNPIKGTYTYRKLRIHGHTRPLEFSGDGRREAESNHIAKAGQMRGGHFWSRATLPRIFNLRNPHSRSNPPVEVTKVLRSEMQILNNLGQQKADAEFRRHSGYKG